MSISHETIGGGTLRGGTLRGGTLRNGTLLDGTLRDGTLRGGTLRGGTLRGGTLRGGTLRGGTLRDGTLRDGTQVAIREENDDNEHIDFILKSDDEEFDSLRHVVLDEYDYKLDENPIASGSFGTVYRATRRYPDSGQNNFGNEVAIKIMNLKTYKNKDEKKQKQKKKKGEEEISERELIQEYNLRYILNDDCKEHLVCYYDVFKCDINGVEKLVLVMSLVTGQELRQIYTDEEKKIIIDQLLTALSILHTNSINHKDIKIENIVYDKAKNYITLLDYGLSCAMPKIPIQVKDCGQLVQGTITYLDPRIVDKIKNKHIVYFDDWRKGDLYSLGVVFYSLWYSIESLYSQNIPWLASKQKTQYIIENTENIYDTKIRNLILNLIQGDKPIEEIINIYRG